eukprot:11726657-Alexandrium_andersonii.AAC.1
MSASLVGSEMCIRDRFSHQNKVFLKFRSARNNLGGGSFPGEAHTWTSQAAVSYTHLTLPTICSV